MDLINIRSYMLAMLAGLLQTSCNLSTWCYDKSGYLFYSTCPHEKEFGDLFEIGGCKKYALTEGANYTKPFLMSDHLGLVWIGEYAKITTSMDTALVLMGPAFISETTAQTLDEKMREIDLPLSMRNIARTFFPDIPVFTMPAMHQYMKMLHYSVTKETLQLKDIVYQSDLHRQAESPPVETAKETHFLDYEKAHTREQMILQCIREGNLNYTQILGDLGQYRSSHNRMAADSFRQAKNEVIVFTALCRRAAMDGKLSIKAAKEIENRYLRSIEKCTTVTELANLQRGVLAEYVNRVHDLTEVPGISQPVRDCCDYIKNHFMEPITLSEIAKSVCYTEYYLTRKFQREMGMSMRDFINGVRLNYAKILLISTEDSIQEISEKIQFGTRNYFTRAFREQEGCTPSEYRERARGINNS